MLSARPAICVALSYFFPGVGTHTITHAFSDQRRRANDASGVQQRVSILRQSRRLYGSRAPQSGPTATQSQNHKLQAAMLMARHLNRETYCGNCQTLAASPAEPGGLPSY